MIATARITAKHGSFNRIRQEAPICTPSKGWFLMPMRVLLQTAYRSVQPFLQELTTCSVSNTDILQTDTQTSLHQVMHKDSADLALFTMLSMPATGSDFGQYLVTS